MGQIKLVIHGEWSWGDETRNVFYLDGGDAAVANGQFLVDETIDVLMQNKAIFTDEYSLVGGTVYDVTTPGVPGLFFTHSSGAQVGTGTADPLAGQVAFLLNMWAYTTKPNRKRTYLAGLTEGSMTNGLWTAGVVAIGQDIIDDLLDFGTVTSAALGMNAYGLLPNGVDYDMNALDDGRAEQVPATQRRRRRGTGI